MAAKQKRSLFIRFGDLALGKKQFRFESHLLPSQCAERIEKLAYRTFRNQYFYGPCRLVSLNRIDENTHDFILNVRTNNPLGFGLAWTTGHIDIDSLTSYTTVQGTVASGAVLTILLGLLVTGTLVCLWISAYNPLFLLGVIVCLFNFLFGWGKMREAHDALLDEIEKAVTPKR